MSLHQPKIVLLGKSKSSGCGAEIQEMLKHINASQIPIQILEGVYVMLSGDEEYKLDSKHMPKDKIDYDSLERFLAGIKWPKDKTIEGIKIVIDLDAADALLNVKVANFLDPLFEIEE